jgi:hypothetical protein
MDWGALAGFTLLLTMVIFALRLLWYWLIVLIVLGPPTYAGIMAGQVVGVHFESMGAGLFTAVIVSGCLIEAVRRGLRRVR